MKVWVYVEGKSDKEALSVLWKEWKQKLGSKSWQIQCIPLKGKSRFFRSVGPRAAARLLQDKDDLVVGLPDLYPNREYANTEYGHKNLQELKVDVQRQLVKRSLLQQDNLAEVSSLMSRFYASALKHDMEMLLLAALNHPLRSQRRKNDASVSWRFPPEEQNQNRPPKKLVEELFLTTRKRSYRAIADSFAILSETTLPNVLFDGRGNEQCPEFRSMLDWVGEKTGVPAYKKSKR